MRLAGESACPTTGKAFACIGGTGFSLSTPACGRISSQHLREGLPKSNEPPAPALIAVRQPVPVLPMYPGRVNDSHDFGWVEGLGQQIECALAEKFHPQAIARHARRHNH